MAEQIISGFRLHKTPWDCDKPMQGHHHIVIKRSWIATSLITHGLQRGTTSGANKRLYKLMIFWIQGRNVILTNVD